MSTAKGLTYLAAAVAATSIAACGGSEQQRPTTAGSGGATTPVPPGGTMTCELASTQIRGKLLAATLSAGFPFAGGPSSSRYFVERSTSLDEVKAPSGAKIAPPKDSRFVVVVLRVRNDTGSPVRARTAFGRTLVVRGQRGYGISDGCPAAAAYAQSENLLRGADFVPARSTRNVVMVYAVPRGRKLRYLDANTRTTIRIAS